MKIRFYIDPEIGMPHIHRHGVREDEAIWQTGAGRYLRVIYVPDPDPESVFVITAYELKGKPLAAYEDSSQTFMEIPNALVPKVRELIAKHKR